MRWAGPAGSGRLAEHDLLHPQHERAERHQQSGDERNAQRRLPREGGRDQHEFAREHAERRQPGNRDHGEGEQHREHRMGDRNAA